MKNSTHHGPEVSIRQGGPYALPNACGLDGKFGVARGRPTPNLTNKTAQPLESVSYTHLRAHETSAHL
eukprot:11732783-Alexandrium_andersonii.AAC.1